MYSVLGVLETALLAKLAPLLIATIGQPRYIGQQPTTDPYVIPIVKTITASGTNSTGEPLEIILRIVDGVSSPNTVAYAVNGGAESPPENITGSPIAIGATGISIAFAATTGYTHGSRFAIQSGVLEEIIASDFRVDSAEAAMAMMQKFSTRGRIGILSISDNIGLPDETKHQGVAESNYTALCKLATCQTSERGDSADLERRSLDFVCFDKFQRAITRQQFDGYENPFDHYFSPCVYVASRRYELDAALISIHEFNVQVDSTCGEM